MYLALRHSSEGQKNHSAFLYDLAMVLKRRVKLEKAFWETNVHPWLQQLQDPLSIQQEEGTTTEVKKLSATLAELGGSWQQHEHLTVRNLDNRS